jgi:hypothetical protein
MSEWPSGTGMYLFIDIAGSTKLCQDSPATMPSALAYHHESLRETMDFHSKTSRLSQVSVTAPESDCGLTSFSSSSRSRKLWFCNTRLAQERQDPARPVAPFHPASSFPARVARTDTHLQRQRHARTRFAPGAPPLFSCTRPRHFTRRQRRVRAYRDTSNANLFHNSGSGDCEA